MTERKSCSAEAEKIENILLWHYNDNTIIVIVGGTHISHRVNIAIV